VKLRVLLLALLLVVLPEVALAQIPDLNSLLPPGNGSTSARIIQLMAVITVLSVAPGLLIMVTSFTRFAVALSFLRAGLGLQTTPANLVLISLARFMTFYVMAPTFDRAWETGIQPLMKNEISEEEAYLKITDPFREFMLAHVRDKDLQTFESLAAESFRPGWSWLALAEDRVVGFVLNSAAPHPTYGRVGWTDQLGVLPRWRGRGLGAHLMCASLNAFEAAGLRMAGLGLDTQNPFGAPGLYARLGYRPGFEVHLFIRSEPGLPDGPSQ